MAQNKDFITIGGNQTQIKINKLFGIVANCKQVKELERFMRVDEVLHIKRQSPIELLEKRLNALYPSIDDNMIEEYRKAISLLQTYLK